MKDDSLEYARYIDPHIQFKKSDVRNKLVYHANHSVFSLVEFNIWGACNRSCEFCPVANPEVYTNRKEGISLGDYAKIVNDLAAINYKGIILWSMFSEPTLHKEIISLVRITKDLLPNVALQLTSNGDTFRRRPDKLKALFYSGVDRINLSLYDGPEQLAEFTQLINRLRLSEDQIKLRRRYLEGGNYGITISNRAGAIDSNKFRDKREKFVQSLPLNRPCYYPFYQVAIDYNGDVLLCPHDWSKEYIAGNAVESNIWEIWTGPKFNSARKLLGESSRSFRPCNKCDVAGDVIGEKSFSQFSYNKNSPRIS